MEVKPYINAICLKCEHPESDTVYGYVSDGRLGSYNFCESCGAEFNFVEDTKDAIT